ncbi:MAG: MBL fold metallo-hydrolase [Dysgonamonadaceae bacterium]|nr:MBL fold metallo-hydrolase [Dysgonamonadaceae bacterium]
MLKFHLIESGYFLGDGGVMFGPVPKRYWSKHYPCDENNMCEMSLRCLLLETEDRKILVDTGVGDKHFSKIKFYKPHDIKNIPDEIRKLGITPEEITDIVLTHLHFDHCGACTIINDQQEIVPTFPNATYWVSKAQWGNYSFPPLFEKSSYFSDNIEPIYEAEQIKFVNEDMQLTKNIRLELYNGHTPGQIAVFFETSEESYVFPSDVVPTSLHRRLDWLSAYDNNLALAMEEKQRFMNKVKKDNRTLIFYHDAYTKMAKAGSK